MGKFVDLKAADGTEFPAYVAQPQEGTRGAIVLLQEIFGVNPHIRAVADGYSEQGYLVVAPSTFHRVQPGVELGYTADDMAAGFGLKTAVDGLPQPGVIQDIQAAVRHAASAGKVGVVGYCWGGLLAWRAACSVQGLSAAVCYYGGGMTTADEAARVPQVPVLAHFGERDHWIPLDSVEAFRKAQPQVEVHVYAADHGFNCDQRGSWDAAAAAAARQRSLAFFAQHLRA